jgi:hypothetical protein
MAGPGGSEDIATGATAKKRKVVCEPCGLVGHVTRMSQKCKYSTNEIPPAVETAESENNEHNNEQHGKF